MSYLITNIIRKNIIFKQILNNNNLKLLSNQRIQCFSDENKNNENINKNQQQQDLNELDIEDEMNLIEKKLNNDNKLGGFAKAFEKYTNPVDKLASSTSNNETFAALLRKSKFIDVSKKNKHSNTYYE